MAEKNLDTATAGARDAGGPSQKPSRLAALRGSRWLPLVCALVALLPILVVCLVQPPVYAMLVDDCEQNLYARGQFVSEPSSLLMPYSLAPVSVPLGLLYQALPQVPWYPLVLLALIWATFYVVFTRAARSRLSDPMWLSAWMVMLACEIVSLFYFTYTVVAFLAVAAGLVLLLDRAAFERPRGVRASDVAGLALVFFGYALRPESGQAAFVIFCPFAVWVLARNRNLGSILRGVAAVACVVAATVIGQVAYSVTPGWEDYPAYLEAGRSTLDYPPLSTEEIRAIAPELSEADAQMLGDWMFADTDVFPASLFERLGSERPHFSLDYLIDSLKAKTTYAMLGLMALTAVLAWLVMRDVGAGRGAYVLAFSVVAMLLVSCLVLAVRSRPRLHVVIPLAIVTMMALLVCAHAPAGARGSHLSAARSAGLLSGAARRVVPAAVGVFCLAVCAGFWWIQVRPEQAKLTAPTTVATREYVEEHPDQLIVLNLMRSINYYGAGNVFEFDGWEYPENAISTGGWQYLTGPWSAAMERLGLNEGTPLIDLVDREDAVMIVQDMYLPEIVAYLSEHAGADVEAQVVEDLGGGYVAVDSRVLVVRFQTA